MLLYGGIVHIATRPTGSKLVTLRQLYQSSFIKCGFHIMWHCPILNICCVPSFVQGVIYRMGCFCVVWRRAWCIPQCVQCQGEAIVFPNPHYIFQGMEDVGYVHDVEFFLLAAPCEQMSVSPEISHQQF